MWNVLLLKREAKGIWDTGAANTYNRQYLGISVYILDKRRQLIRSACVVTVYCKSYMDIMVVVFIVSCVCRFHFFLFSRCFTHVSMVFHCKLSNPILDIVSKRSLWNEDKEKGTRAKYYERVIFGGKIISKLLSSIQIFLQYITYMNSRESFSKPHSLENI